MSARKSRIVLLFLLLVAALSALFWIGRMRQSTSDERPQQATIDESERNPISDEGLRRLEKGGHRPSGAADEKGRNFPKSASRRMIIMDDLAVGIMQLPENSRLSLTVEQARRIRDIYKLVYAGFVRETYIRWRMQRVLTKEQMDFVKKRGDEMNPIEFHYSLDLDKAVVADLRNAAGLRPGESVKAAEVPSGFRAEDAAPHFAFNPVFITNFHRMQKSEALRLSRDQAREALPYVLLYFYNIPAERPPYQVLKVLTDEQKAFIDNLRRPVARGGLDHQALILKFRAFIEEKAGRT